MRQIVITCDKANMVYDFLYFSLVSRFYFTSRSPSVLSFSALLLPPTSQATVLPFMVYTVLTSLSEHDAKTVHNLANSFGTIKYRVCHHCEDKD
jgi:hypothetical protein